MERGGERSITRRPFGPLSRRSDTGNRNTSATASQGTPPSRNMGINQSSMLGMVKQWAGEKLDEGLVSECTICLEPLPCPAPRPVTALMDLRLVSIAPTDLAAPTCGHVYHRFCLENWLISAEQRQRRTCPVCGKDAGNVRRVYVGVATGLHNSAGGARTRALKADGVNCEECPKLDTALKDLHKKYEESTKAQETTNIKCKKLIVDLAAAKKELEALQAKLVAVSTKSSAAAAAAELAAATKRVAAAKRTDATKRITAVKSAPAVKPSFITTVRNPNPNVASIKPATQTTVSSAVRITRARAKMRDGQAGQSGGAPRP